MTSAGNRPVVLLDTGPLVAALSRNDQAHAWAKSQFAALPAPFLTCEAVVSEACFLLRKFSGGASSVLALLESGAVQIGLNLADEAAAVRKLLDRYDHVGFFTKVGGAEPFTQITRTRIDNLVIEYRARAEELRAKKPTP